MWAVGGGLQLAIGAAIRVRWWIWWLVSSWRNGGDSQVPKPPISLFSFLFPLERKLHQRNQLHSQNACASIYSSSPPALHYSSAILFFLFFLFFFSCCGWGGEGHQRWPQERLDQTRDQVHLRLPPSRSPLPWGLLSFSLLLCFSNGFDFFYFLHLKVCVWLLRKWGKGLVFSWFFWGFLSGKKRILTRLSQMFVRT